MKYLPEMNWLEPEATMFEDVWREDYLSFFFFGLYYFKKSR